MPKTNVSKVPSHYCVRLPASSTLFWGLLSTLFAWCAFHTPFSVGWRDSGEFLISSFYLDVPHAAGFPTFSLLANLANLGLMGPIAWRTYLFGTICIILLLHQTAALSRDLLAKPCRGQEELTYLGAFALLASESSWRAIFTAEAYGLHALLVIITFRCVVLFVKRNDARFLFLAGLLGGLTVGNHIVASLIGVWVGIVLTTFRTISPRVGATTVLFFLVGLSVYTYIPVRAGAHPPLNTGNAVTAQRFFRQITNARDRELRAAPLAQSDQHSRSPLLLLGSDSIRLLDQLPLGWIILLPLGISILLLTQPLYATLLAGLPLTTLLFFAGWDIDPWLIAVTSLSCFLSCGASGIYSAITCSSRSLKLGWALALILLTSTLVGRVSEVSTTVSKSIGRASARTRALQLLDSVPSGGVLITEPSWFTSLYARVIEGIRPDIVLLYQPSLLFPGYFAETSIATPSGSLSFTKYDQLNAPQFGNVFSLINTVSQYLPIQLEPTPLLGEPVREILRFESDGEVRIRQRQERAVEPLYPGAVALRISALLNEALLQHGSARNDSEEHAKTLYAQSLATLIATDNEVTACSLASKVGGLSPAGMGLTAFASSFATGCENPK